MKFAAPSFGLAFFLIAFASSFVAMSQPDSRSIAMADTNEKKFKTAVSLFLNGEFDQSIPLFKETESKYKAIKNHRQVVACYMGLTNCYFFKGDYEKAMEYSEKALSLHTSKVKDDPEGLDTIISTRSLCKDALIQSRSTDSSNAMVKD